MPDITLTSIHVYPVKSLRGIALTAWQVTPRGLEHDRRWMLVDDEGVFLTQREHPQMARVSALPVADGLQISADVMPPLHVPFPAPDAPSTTVRVWRSLCEAQRAGGAADQWLTDFLGRTVHLVFMPDTTRRLVNPDYAIHPEGNAVSFADGYPLLVIGEASLADLNARLAHSLPMDRFRPSLVVSGAPAFAEDGWKRVSIGGCLFHGVKPCDRCAVTTINQQTGERGLEPLPTLASFRRRDGKVFFGQYLIPEGTGRVRVGDAVEV